MTTAIRRISALFKLRIGVAIMLCALAGFAMMPGGELPAWKLVVLALAVLLSAASAGAFNQYYERELDARMERTRNRPFATGVYHAGAGWLVTIVAILVLAVAAAAWALNTVTAFYVFMGAFFYGVVYTVWLKNRTWLNIVVGGLAGSFAVLAGAAAVDPGLAPAPIILAVVLFLWTPPHFWSLATALHKDYARAGVPMLPVVFGDRTAAWVILGHTVVLVALSLLPVAYGMGWIYLLAALGGGAYFVYTSLRLVQNPGRPAAMVNFHASLMQLGLVLIAALLDRGLLG
jgi:protoheme IX farnesyltransferase